MYFSAKFKCFTPIVIFLYVSFIDIRNCTDVSITITPIWDLKQYLKEKFQSSSVEVYNDMNLISPPPKFNKNLFLGILHAKYNRNQLMAHCETKEDCDAGIRMICEHNRCTCKHGELFFEWPKYGCFVKARMFDKCEVSGQCMAMNPNTYCNPENGRCTCSPNYFFNGHECSLRYDSSNLKAQEVYKAAVVAAACFIVAVVGIFVACIVRRSFCRREQHLQQSESNRNSDIFTISDEIAALRAVDKPPTYEEVLQIERTFYGIPPPEYSGPRSEVPSPSLQLASAGTHVPGDSLNLSSNPAFQSTSVASNSGSSSLTEYLKDSTIPTRSLGESSRDNSHLQTACASDFVTAAEVLPVPFDEENTDQIIPPLLSGASSHIAHSSYSSTPPPRLHRNHIKYEQGSSSLPSSPYMSTISSKIGAISVGCHTASKKELLKQDSSATQPETSHLSQDSFPSHSETSSNISVPLDVGTHSNASEYEHSVTVIAYDNLGFESDLYL